MMEITSSNDRTYLPTYDRCFVCGQNHSHGLRLRFFAGEDGQVHTLFQPNDNQTGYENVVHGGVISALLDEILGWPIVLQTGRMFFTGELTVRFLKPLIAKHTYLATAYPGEARGRYWEGKGEIRDEEGAIYAKATGKYFTLSAEQSEQVITALNYQADDLQVPLDVGE